MANGILRCLHNQMRFCFSWRRRDLEDRYSKLRDSQGSFAYTFTMSRILESATIHSVRACRGKYGILLDNFTPSSR